MSNMIVRSNALGQWKQEAQSAGMPTLDVPDEGTPLTFSGPEGP